MQRSDDEMAGSTYIISITIINTAIIITIITPTMVIIMIIQRSEEDMAGSIYREQSKDITVPMEVLVKDGR